MLNSLSIKDSPTIAIIAGEVSGDILGAGLIHALKARYPQAKFIGIGGERMIAEGFETLFDMEELSVMGLVEVLKHLPRLLKIRRSIIEQLSALKPDVFIGIDAPDFNLDVELKLKQRGIKTIHYVSPSVWAWRQKRVYKIAAATNLVLAFLPFEKAFYDRFNVPCRFIGHTMADAIPLKPNREEACQLLNLDSKKRRQQFEQIKQRVAPELDMILLDGNARAAMIAAEATLLASGTAALEAMLCKSPMVVGYRMKPFTYFLAKRLVKTQYISLPNLLADEMLVPELIQEDCNPTNLAEKLSHYLSEDKSAVQNRHVLLQRFAELHQMIQCNADQQAAQAVIDLLEQSHG